MGYSKQTFVTVARLSEEKGILRCIPIFKKIKEDGYEFEWHIVGDGAMRCAIEKEIARYGLEKNIVLEGEQLNPYRYLKNANYFLLPSFHEAAPMVFDEANTLNVPMLTTKTLSAIEMVEKRGAGLVCENNEDAIYEMLHRVISGKQKFHMTNKPDNEICMKQFNNLCNQQ